MRNRYRFKITSPSGFIGLDCKLSDVIALKVHRVRFEEITAGQKEMLVSIEGYDNQTSYPDRLPFLVDVELPEFPNTNAIYNDPSLDNPEWTADENNKPKQLQSIRYTVYIDGQINNDISPANPLYINMTFVTKN